MVCCINKKNTSSIKTIKLFSLLSRFGFIVILSSSLSIDTFGPGTGLEINMFQFLVAGLVYIETFKHPGKPVCYKLSINVTIFVCRGKK